MELLRTLFWSFGLVVFLLGIQGMLYFPLTLAYEMRRRGVELGVASLCGGGGQGDALIIKRIA